MQGNKIIGVCIKKTVWLLSEEKRKKINCISSITSIRKSKKYHWCRQYDNHCDLDQSHFCSVEADELPTEAG